MGLRQMNDVKTTSVEEKIVGATVIIESMGSVSSTGKVSLHLVPTEPYKSYDYKNRYKLSYDGEVFYSGNDIKSLLEEAYVEVYHGNPQIKGSMNKVFITDVLSAIKRIYENFYPVEDTTNVAINNNIIKLSMRTKLDRKFIKTCDTYDETARNDVGVWIKRTRVSASDVSNPFYRTVVRVTMSDDVELMKRYYHDLDNIPCSDCNDTNSESVRDMIRHAVDIFMSNKL